MILKSFTNNFRIIRDMIINFLNCITNFTQKSHSKNRSIYQSINVTDAFYSRLNRRAYNNRRFPSFLSKTIATLIIPPPKYSQALLHNCADRCKSDVLHRTASTKALGLQGVSKNTRLFWTYTRV